MWGDTLRGARQFALALLICGLIPARPLFAAPQIDGRVVVVESRDAAGRIDRQRLLTVLRQACAELHLDEAAVPRILVVHLTAGEALVGAVPAGAGMMVEKVDVKVEHGEPTSRFIVWLVGQPSDQRLVHAAVDVLSHHLGLALSAADTLSTERRLSLRLAATVDAKSLLK